MSRCLTPNQAQLRILVAKLPHTGQNMALEIPIPTIFNLHIACIYEYMHIYVRDCECVSVHTHIRCHHTYMHMFKYVRVFKCVCVHVYTLHF